MDKTAQLKAMMELLSASATKQEVTDAFAALIKFVRELKQFNAQEFALMKSAISMLGEKMKEDVGSDMSGAKKEMMEMCMKEMTAATKKIDKMSKEQMDGMKYIFDKVAGLENGKDADETKIVADVLSKIPAQKEETPVETRDKLETLKENERLDKSAIKGIEQIEKDIKEISIRPTGRIGGAKGIGLYIGGSKKLLTAQTINMVAGTGITISYAHANGRNDITITATGSASLTPITVTGTVDDSNTAFTAASAPSLVIVNGASYRDGHGATIVGTAITLDNPVGTGGDIYCL